ncbi:MAG: PilN domain-containing protein [Woeseiaceae bacterium]|nr:PilN domain-containing protein [Woeseiaceae bacterium]
MADIDLIPNEYRTWLRQRSMLKVYGSAFLALNVLVCAVALLLDYAVTQSEKAAVQLRSANAITQQQQVQLDQLQSQRGEYERQWSLLRGLRAGAEVEDIFEIIDRSLVGEDLWFLEWSFRRAGVIVDGEQRGVETGYFIIVAEDGSATNAELKVETHMSVAGQARDHQALSRFVRNLFEQPDIKDVSVQRTSQARIGRSRVVDFDLTIVLNSTPREG